MEDRLEIGKIVNTHGLRGEVKAVAWCDEPELFEELAYIYIDGSRYDIKAVRYQKANLILSLEGIDSIEQAGRYKNKVMQADRSQLDGLIDGERYFITDLIGLEVFWGERLLGQVADVIATGANDVYSIKTPEGRELLIPAISQVVKEIDIKRRIMRIEPIEGMIDGAV